VRLWALAHFWFGPKRLPTLNPKVCWRVTSKLLTRSFDHIQGGRRGAKLLERALVIPLHLLCQRLLPSIVFRPDPVQGLDFRFWPGRPGQKNFKSKRHRYSKKNKTKVNGLQSGFAGSTGSLGQPVRSHRVFSSPVFFSIRPGSSPGFLVNPSGQAGF
jgi:hypothetical protein